MERRADVECVCGQREKPMGQSSLFGRAILAVSLTTVASPLLLAIVYIAGVSMRGGSADGLGELVLVMWFFGILVALPFALLLGAMVEWPKVLLALRRGHPAPLILQVLISMAAGVALLVGYTLANVFSQSLPAGGAIPALTFNGVAGAIGGMCSASSWWKLVTKPALVTG